MRYPTWAEKKRRMEKLLYLLRHRKLSISEVKREAKVTWHTAKNWLKKLHKKGLLKTMKLKRERVYWINEEKIRGLARKYGPLRGKVVEWALDAIKRKKS